MQMSIILLINIDLTQRDQNERGFIYSQQIKTMENELKNDLYWVDAMVCQFLENMSFPISGKQMLLIIIISQERLRMGQ
jgi:hypothetical protein